jgi:hypothetical protein
MHYFHSLLSRRFVTALSPNHKNALQSVKLHALLRVFAFALICFVAPSSSVWAGDQANSAPPEPSTLLVRVTKAAKMIGYPAVCPGSSEDENQDEIICMAELYEARVHVLNNLGGPQTERDLTIRFTAHSFHVVWQKDVRFLLVVSPFEDNGATGYFAFRWDWDDEQGQFCEELDYVNSAEIEPIKRAFALGKVHIIGKDNDHYTQGSKLICITGHEKGFGQNG